MLLGNEYGIIEFPLQQWLRERAAMLHCLSCLFFAQSMYIIKPNWGSHVSSRLFVNFISKNFVVDFDKIWRCGRVINGFNFGAY